ncbi:MAG: 2-amino-4-hydroxy-6-hydroxymethyldihydropteridine diphosphokinase [Gemmatimonadales bacterium]
MMAVRERVLVALGSNLGDRAGHLDAARQALAQLPETRLVAVSSVEETAPLGGLRQPAYLNQMALLETGLAPRALLRHLHRIEADRGRARRERWAPRTLDLDIVRFGDQEVAEPDLTLPHPGLAEREFWRREIEELDAHER